tara:strand:+ start:162 stop:344 length:183 start_codon:yes stop_codon:yes gene_type:complete
MNEKNKKGFKWDGKTRVSTDLYRKNFNKIFNTKERGQEDDVGGRYKEPSQNDRETTEKHE